MRGNWNVSHAVSQQVFRVTTFCINTCFQSFSTLIIWAEIQPMSQQAAAASLNMSVSVHALFLTRALDAVQSRVICRRSQQKRNGQDEQEERRAAFISSRFRYARVKVTIVMH